MSESREKKRRYNLKLEYIARFQAWANSEPPMLLFWRWQRWIRQRPVLTLSAETPVLSAEEMERLEAQP